MYICVGDRAHDLSENTAGVHTAIHRSDSVARRRPTNT